MINASNVEAQFLQTGNSCVLASYGIVGNYFTGQPIGNFFIEYCNHFSLQFTAGQAEHVYNSHFHGYLIKHNICGYIAIRELHNHSSQPVFAQFRSVFSACFSQDSNPQIAFFEQTL